MQDMMTQEEYKTAAKDVTYLAACMVNREKPDTGRVGKMGLEHLYTVA